MPLLLNVVAAVGVVAVVTDAVGGDADGAGLHGAGEVGREESLLARRLLDAHQPTLLLTEGAFH